MVNGYKTWLAAAGLVGLAVFQTASGDYAGAFQSVLGALAAVGLRHAIDKQVDEVYKAADEVKQVVAANKPK